MAWDSTSFRRRVLAVIHRIPRGKVATYGQIAALAGYPRNARRVGQALGGAGPDVPWQRVVNAQGRVSLRAPRPDRAIGARELQQENLLKAEGIVFKTGALSLAKYRWRPLGKPAKFPDAKPPKRKVKATKKHAKVVASRKRPRK
jgi:methylated-DNA-protein-cysteine methyltransferase-like protein